MNQTASTIHPLSQRIRNLVLAAAASVAILAVPATQAHAATEQPNLCHGYTSSGNHEFFLPGERVKGADGKWYFCGPDGRWYPYYGTVSLNPTTNPTTPKLTILVAPTSAFLAR